MKSAEPCARLPLLGRVVVNQPALLSQPGWREHLRECPACREEATAGARAVAVFQHVESARLADGVPEGPSWERVSAALGRRQGSWRRLGRSATVAAAAGMILFSGALAWDMLDEDLPSARVVALGPEQQRHMREVIGQSLGVGYPALPRTPVRAIASEEGERASHGLYASGDGAISQGPHESLSHPVLPADTKPSNAPFLGPLRTVPITPVRFPGAR